MENVGNQESNIENYDQRLQVLVLPLAKRVRARMYFSSFQVVVGGEKEESLSKLLRQATSTLQIADFNPMA